VDAWLTDARDRIAETTGVDPTSLALDDDTVGDILELAKVAAHESGERTNAPLVCYLAGLAAGRSGADAADVVDAASARRSD